MTLYIIIVAILCIFTFVAVKKRTRKIEGVSFNAPDMQTYRYNKTYNWLVCVFLVFLWALTAFRGAKVGNDTQAYLDIFKRVQEKGIDGEYRYEIGFQALCYVIGIFTDNPQALLVICATICYLGIGLYILKYSKNILISGILVFCLCFSNFTNILRQDLAMVICLYAYQALKRKKHVVALLLILFAATFHSTALITLLWFPYKYVKHNLVAVTIAALLICVLSAMGALGVVLSAIAGPYRHYFETYGSGGIAVAYMIARSFVLYCFVYSAYKKKQRAHRLVLMNMLIALFTMCFAMFANLFDRIAAYFLLAAIVDIPNAYYEGNVKNKSTWLSLICLVSLAYFIVVLIFRPEWNRLYPYSFFWS